MNLAAEIASAHEFLHRSIGQRVRWAHYAVAILAAQARAEIERAAA